MPKSKTANKSKKTKAALSVAELSTVLAALRHYQHVHIDGGISDLDHANAIDSIATNDHDFNPLDTFPIDALCERLNTN